MGRVPTRGKHGEAKHGFTIGERVEVTAEGSFRGWHGHVQAFDDKLVAVDLDEPPEGHSPNGQWFLPNGLLSKPQ